MRPVSEAMTAAWKSTDKTGGDRRPTVRATIQRAELQKFDYDTATAPGGDLEPERHRRGTFTSIIFGDISSAIELNTIQSVEWSRSVDQDVATCTIELLNTRGTPIGSADDDDYSPNGDFDLPGDLTYNRGAADTLDNRWGHDTDTGWQNLISTDRLIKTYEGYGYDMTVAPALDANLMQSGTWLVDKVTYTDTGTITLECRDVGRLLLDQIVFPPVIPFEEYPLAWDKIRSQNVEARDCTGGSWGFADGTASSSNEEYIGRGLHDPPLGNYVGPGGAVNGHRPSHALSDDVGEGDRYWWSTGQTSRSSKVWWQVDLDEPTNLAGVRIALKRGPYVVYVSVKTDRGWVGRKKIPYEVTTEGVNVGAGIRFVKAVNGDAANAFDIILPRKYKNVTAVRLTFSRLINTTVGNYPFRAGLKWMKLYTASSFSSLGFAKGQALKVVGNYRDYTDIVKWVGAWGGFYWPSHDTGKDFVMLSKGDDPVGARRTISFLARDTRLPKGRVWGDFEQTGTAGVAQLTIDLFDKKPLMDIINYVRDVVGYNFFIDETGGMVWRMPNLWKLGNYISPGNLDTRPIARARTSQIITIDEEETLLEYSTTLDSADVREVIFVGNNTGKIGMAIKGFTPYYTGFRRIAGWTDQHFETKREVRIMADMLSARQMFNWRTSKVTIPANPAIQVDDQIRILERVTNETSYHYVKGITSSLDMQAGTWQYQLETHWLGKEPSDAWAVRVDQLDGITQQYLKLVGVGDS